MFMKKLIFSGVLAAAILGSCGNPQQENEYDDDLEVDTVEEPMYPTDTTDLSAPVDTAVDASPIQ